MKVILSSHNFICFSKRTHVVLWKISSEKKTELWNHTNIFFQSRSSMDILVIGPKLKTLSLGKIYLVLTECILHSDVLFSFVYMMTN